MPRKPLYDRDDLIHRARDLFWKQGWAGTSLKDLEKTLNMNPGSFYAAFGSKDALYTLALDKYALDGAERLDALAAELGPLEALQNFPFLVIEGEDKPALACMLSKTVLEVPKSDDKIYRRAKNHLSAMERRFAGLFQSAQNRGDISANHDHEMLARRYQSDLLGLRMTAERDLTAAKLIAEDIAKGLSAL